MDYIRDTIKSYVLVISPNIADNDLLDYIVAEVVDRAIVYLNRYHLIEDYEDEIATDGFDYNDPYDEQYRPLPKPLWRSLARVVVGAYKEINNDFANVDNTTTTSSTSIKRIRDNGQEIEYGESSTSYFDSTSDQQIFSSISVQLDNYRLINTDYANSSKFYRRNFTSVL